MSVEILDRLFAVTRAAVIGAKLARDTAYTSPDGVTWAQLQGPTVRLSSLSGTLLAGLAVASRNANAICAVTFERITFPI